MQNYGMQLPEKNNEPWLRAHRLQILAISIALTALVVGAFSAVAGWIKIPFVARYFNLEKIIEGAQEEDPPITWAEYSVDEVVLLQYLDSLPARKKTEYAVAQKAWDTGTTVVMNAANDDYIEFLKNAWIRTAEYFPPKHFGGKLAKDFIEAYIEERAAYHWGKKDTGKEYAIGTSTNIEVGGEVIDDLDKMIVETVESIPFEKTQFDFKKWKKRWQNK